MKALSSIYLSSNKLAQKQIDP